MKNRARDPKLGKLSRVRNPLRLDPTRTTMLRKAAIADVRRRFARLALALDELIVRQDSFGLRERRRTDPFATNAEYASTQFNVLSPEVAAEIDRMQRLIDPADVIKYDRDPHVTVRYGLTEERVDDVRRIVTGSGQVYARVGRLSLFQLPEKDVLKFAIEGDGLHRLNHRLSLLPHVDTHPLYQPHLTVAYLRPGAGDKYLNASNALTGLPLRFDVVQFSDVSREHTPIAINLASNAFCPTGEGGGQDNSCSSSSGGSSHDKVIPPEYAIVAYVAGGDITQGLEGLQGARDQLLAGWKQFPKEAKAMKREARRKLDEMSPDSDTVTLYHVSTSDITKRDEFGEFRSLTTSSETADALRGELGDKSKIYVAQVPKSSIGIVVDYDDENIKDYAYQKEVLNDKPIPSSLFKEKGSGEVVEPRPTTPRSSKPRSQKTLDARGKKVMGGTPDFAETRIKELMREGVKDAGKISRKIYKDHRVSTSEAWVREFMSEVTQNVAFEVRMSVTSNAFCPTGEGGGVDPSCGKDGSGMIRDKHGNEHKVHYDEASRTYSISVPGKEDMLTRGVTAGGVTMKRDLSGVMSVGVRGEFQRRGLASAMYDHIEKHIGKPLQKNWATTPDGEALWKSREARSKATINERWELKTSPERLKLFQDWLARQLKWTVVGATKDQLWAKYVEEGFVKGAGRAFDDVKSRRGASFRRDDLAVGERRQFLSSSFRRPETVEKVKLLASRTFEEMVNVGEEVKLKLGRVLVDGLTQGKNPRDVAREMRDKLAMPMRRAETIARTEIIRAHSEGQLNAMEDLGVDEVGVMVEWSTAGDDRVCEACLPMEGVVLKLSEAHGMIPRHPNCLPGHVRVSSVTGIAATSERLYDGDLIVIRTASDLVLSCTPNHPVLTSDGRWSPAHLLNVGDHVVRHLGSQRERGIDDQDEDVPPRIEQVADSFRRSREVTSTEVPTAAPDFHGDGAGSDVAVIRTHCELRHERDLGDRESLAQDHLVRGHVGRRILSRLRSEALLLVGLLSTAYRSIRGEYLRASSVLVHLRPLQRLGLALRSRGDTSFYQSTSDYAASDSECLGNSVLGRAGLVSVDQRVDVEESISPRSILVAEDSDDNLVRDAELARQLASGGAGAVTFDQVVSVTVEKFVGHVYNLETGGGWYVANGIITHNCRCSFIPANVGESRGEQTRGKAKIERQIDVSARLAGDTFDVGIEIDAYRPRSLITPSR